MYLLRKLTVVVEALWLGAWEKLGGRQRRACLPADAFLLIRLQSSPVANLLTESFRRHLVNPSTRRATLHSSYVGSTLQPIRAFAMLFRHMLPAGTLGRAARTLPLGPSRTIAAPTLRLAILTTSATQTRLSSSGAPSHGIPHLSPPWQVSDLSFAEQAAYKEFGPNYIEHVTSGRRRNIIWKAKLRASQAERWQKKYGDAWYEILKEANEINAEKFKALREELKQRMELARSRLLSANSAPPSTDRRVEAHQANEEIAKLRAEVQAMMQQSRESMDKIADELARSRGIGKTEES